MLYEAVLEAPTSDLFEQHQWIDSLLKTDNSSEKDYIWKYSDSRNVSVRRRTKLIGHGQWQEVIIPGEGSKICFSFDAHLRRGHYRKGAVGLPDALKWFERKVEAIGLTSADYNAEESKLVTSRGLFKTIWHFNGIANIVAPDLFEHAVAHGISNAKAYGLGFLLFSRL